MEYSFDKPTNYRIRVLGILDKNWSERLAGMSIKSSSEDRGPITVLSGTLRDQAELSGVLNFLYALQCTLLSVEELLGE